MRENHLCDKQLSGLVNAPFRSDLSQVGSAQNKQEKYQKLVAEAVRKDIIAKNINEDLQLGKSKWFKKIHLVDLD